MRCVVTGANGFVGSHLVDLLLAEGHQVTALVRPTSNLRWLEGKPITLVKGSLEDPDTLRQGLGGAELVFHVAGVVNATNLDAYLRVNARGTATVGRAFLEHCPKGRRFVLVSSQSVVGPTDNPATEQMEPRPINMYGQSKLAGEQEALALAPDLPLSIVRPGPIYGPRDAEALPLMSLAARGFHLRLGWRSAVSNMCHVQDVARGALLAATRDEALGQTFMLGGAENYPINQLMRKWVAELHGGAGIPLWLPVSAAYAAGAAGELWCRVSGKTVSLNLDRVRMLTAGDWPLDISKMRQLLGYEPRWDVCTGATQTVKWAKEQGWI